MDATKVVILCGGKGTRSRPFTEYFPKVMMPINGTPILVHLMRIYASQGFNRFILAAGYRIEILSDYFHGRFPDWEVSIIDTGADSDTGERVRRCADHVGDTFFATYGDGLGDIDLRALLEFHRRSGGQCTLTTVPLRSQYGLVHFSPTGLVDRFEEKPLITSYWINAGFFAFQKSAFDFWHGQNLESEVLPALARHDVLYSYQHDGFWRSMDTSKDQHELEMIHRREGVVWSRSGSPAPATE